MTDWLKVFVQLMRKHQSVSNQRLSTEWSEQDIIMLLEDNISMTNPYCATVMADRIRKVLDSKFLTHTDSKFLH